MQKAVRFSSTPKLVLINELLYTGFR